MAKKKYLGVKEAEEQRKIYDESVFEEKPDFIGMAPNYEKFPCLSVEQILVMLNVD